jgi:uncharacterized protein (TIGR00730 family)
MDEIVVSVFGTGRVKPDQPVYGFAEQVGRALALAGFTIANGGYRGIMQASAKGAAETGGTVIGVTCSAFKKSVANEYVTREMTTRSLDERLSTLVKLGRAYVVLPGGTGTLLELAMVWELTNKGFLDAGKGLPNANQRAGDPRPIVLAGDFWRPLVDLMARDDPACVKAVAFARTAEDVARLVKERLGL